MPAERPGMVGFRSSHNSSGIPGGVDEAGRPRPRRRRRVLRWLLVFLVCLASWWNHRHAASLAPPTTNRSKALASEGYRSNENDHQDNKNGTSVSDDERFHHDNNDNDRGASATPAPVSSPSTNDRNATATPAPVSSSPPPPDPQPFCFVHVGKTAGGTIGCRLGEQSKHCPATTTTNATDDRLPEGAFLGKLHKHKDSGCFSKGTSVPSWFLVAIRDPVDRLVSWYHYEHPALGRVAEIKGNRPRLYDECFNRLGDLATVGLKWALEGTTGLSAKNKTCALRAWKAATGSVGFQYHNYYNYEYYKGWVHEWNPTPTILVLRNEHLSEDWRGLVGLYHRREDGMEEGGTDYFEKFARHATPSNGGSSTNTSSKGNPTPTPTARGYLCRALCGELKVYRWLLEQAINLAPLQKQHALEELAESCPGVDTTAECPSLHPSLKDHKDPKRLKRIPRYPTPPPPA